MTSKPISYFLAVSTTLFSLALPALGQQPYTFTKVVDNSTQRPDGAGLFTLNATTTPAFDGQWVVFRDIGSADDASLQAIWSFDLKAAKFTKLVDLHSLMPGGTATFTDLHLPDSAPAVRSGTVIFLGRGTSSGQILEGLYSVPAAGGAITPVADYRSADPSGGTFSLFDSAGKQMGGFSFDGTTVAFHGQGTTLTTGIYAAKPDGSSLGLIADSAHPFSAQTAVKTFLYPMMWGSNVVLTGTDGADPATGYNGLYLGRVGGTGTVTELVNSNKALPGDPTGSFHTRFDAPFAGFDGSTVAFRATDSAAPAAAPFYGLYWTDLTSHAINKIVDVNSTLPGLGKLRAIADSGADVSLGNVLFRAADITTGYPGNGALYLWANGAATRVVGTGDTVGGKTVQVVHDPGPSALSRASFAFALEFSQTNGFAIYAATTLANYSTASYALSGPLAPGSIASAFGLALADSEASSAPPLPNTLANITLNVKDSGGVTRPAALYYAGPTQINYVIPDTTALGAATVTVAKNGQTVAAGTITVAAVAPGLFAANANGAGAAAAVAVKFPATGASTWQYAATCGTAVGSCVTSPIDLGVPGDRVFLELFGTGIRGYKTGITATIGGTAEPPTFGIQSQYPGMDQVNLPIDRSLIGRGEVDVVLTVDGVAANTVRVNIK